MKNFWNTSVVSLIWLFGSLHGFGSDLCGLPGQCTLRGTTPEAFDRAVWGLAFGNGCFVGVGEELIIKSTNNLVWQAQRLPCAAPLRSVVFAAGLFVAVGDRGSILVSSNGSDWRCQVVGETNHFRGITYGLDRFVAVTAKSAAFVSSNALTWEMSFPGKPDRFMYGIFFGKDTYVAYGAMPYGFGSPAGSILTSTNGVDWIDHNTFTGWAPYTCGAFGGGRFIVAGNRFLCSEDGRNWTTYQDGPNSFAGVTYADGKFVAIGSGFGNWVRTSTNCENWVTRPIDRSLNRIAYGNGEFIAGESYGAILGSPDGITWTQRTPILCGFSSASAVGNGVQVATTGGTIFFFP